MSFSAFRKALEANEVGASAAIHWDEVSARAFLRQQFSNSYDVTALRSVLAYDIHDLSRLSDDDVVAEAARRLRSGAWCIGYDTSSLVSLGGAPAAASRVAPPLEEAAARMPLRQSAPAARRPPVTPSREPEWPEQTDQDAFAIVLEQAALAGIPFCEICAKGRKPEKQTE